jgi:hypothetical protein
MLDAFFTPQDATVQQRLTRITGESRVQRSDLKPD